MRVSMVAVANDGAGWDEVRAQPSRTRWISLLEIVRNCPARPQPRRVADPLTAALTGEDDYADTD